MSTPTIKVKVFPRPVIKAKMDVRFPGRVDVLSPILLDKTGGNFTFSLDVNDLLPMLSGDYLSRAELNYVPDRGSLASRSLSSSEIFIMSDTSEPPLWVPVSGDQSAFIAAGDPRFVAPSSDPTGESGAFVAVGTLETGEFYQEDGELFHRLAGRIFGGDAVNNTGKNIASNGDWLTQFQLGTGRTFGFVQIAQAAFLQKPLDDLAAGQSAANAVVAAAKTGHFTSDGNAIGLLGVAVSDNTTQTTHAYGGYNEAFRLEGSIGGAYGYEIDTVNYESSVSIDPFGQETGQTIGIQLAAGAELDGTGQFSSSAAINIRNNNSNYLSGIVFGNDAIGGTQGTDGSFGQAIAMATGHTIEYYYAAGSRSWRLSAAIGENGDYNFTTLGTGAVSVPVLKTPRIAFGSGSDSAVSVSSANTGFINGLDVQNGGTVSNASTIAVSSVRLAAGTSAYLQMVAAGGAFPAAQLTSGAGLTGGMHISAAAGPLTISSPTLVAPALGTPVSGVATNLTGTAASLVAGKATELSTARAIAISGSTGLTATGVNFDGSAAINLALTGTLAVANGGTGNTGGAFTTYTPTVVCGQSTGTAVGTATGRYQRIGKLTHLTIVISITGTFTGGTFSTATLPVTSASSGTWIISGRENAITGTSWFGTIYPSATTLSATDNSNSNTILTGESIVLTGWYEAA